MRISLSRSPRGSRNFRKNLLPSGISSRLLLRRFAYLSVRLERCERLDTAVYSKRVRHADEDFLDHRMLQVEALVIRLAYDPMTTARRLQATPEGIDWLIGHWGELRGDLMNLERNLWTQNHWSRMERLLGNPEGSFRLNAAPFAHAVAQRVLQPTQPLRGRGTQRPGTESSGPQRAGEDHRRRGGAVGRASRTRWTLGRSSKTASKRPTVACSTSSRRWIRSASTRPPPNEACTRPSRSSASRSGSEGQPDGRPRRRTRRGIGFV